ncbi:Acetyltransferase [Pseudomonas amygdali pv. photiniae]|uniref:Acetyltransferase n=1 Tax=Pseudomonas amygdali pv. photiniae TaxID=251724 RepID=A0A0N8S154_PSEA0|nr:Acetyltransferase [Pseudomonas amygdali pv. photiniae]
MHAPAPQILIQRMAETHLEGVTALYNEPAVCRQVLQMPYQSIEVWRKRLAASTERHVKLVALSGGEVIGSLGLEQYSRSRQSCVITRLQQLFNKCSHPSFGNAIGVVTRL